MYSRNILDEKDESFSVKFQLTFKVVISIKAYSIRRVMQILLAGDSACMAVERAIFCVSRSVIR